MIVNGAVKGRRETLHESSRRITYYFLTKDCTAINVLCPTCLVSGIHRSLRDL